MSDFPIESVMRERDRYRDRCIEYQRTNERIEAQARVLTDALARARTLLALGTPVEQEVQRALDAAHRISEEVKPG